MKKKHAKPKGIQNTSKIDGDVNDGVVISGDHNTVILPDTKQPNVETQKNKVAIAVAWISVIGVISAAIIAAFPQVYPIFMNKTPSPQPTVYTPETFTSTPTFAAPEATFTPISTVEIVTVEPLPTFPQVIPVSIEEDWRQGCISTLWQVYPSSTLSEEQGDGCWKEPVSVFSAEHGNLDFLKYRAKGSEEIYGLFTPLPQKGSVTFTIRLDDLTNADLLMGIFAEPDITSQGLLLAVLNGDVSRTVILQKDDKYQTVQGTVRLDMKQGQVISFEFDPLSIKSRVLPNFFSLPSFSLPDSTKWLFLGFKGLRGSYRIEGRFLNFEFMK